MLSHYLYLFTRKPVSICIFVQVKHATAGPKLWILQRRRYMTVASPKTRARGEEKEQEEKEGREEEKIKALVGSWGSIPANITGNPGEISAESRFWYTDYVF